MAVSDEAGDIKEFNHYDPWGKVTSTRVDPQPPSADVLANSIPRGFTDHEMLLDLGLVHMNGRVYDPVIGRFLSADPFIGDAGDSQDYNGYSYVGNNPFGRFPEDDGNYGRALSGSCLYREQNEDIPGQKLKSLVKLGANFTSLRPSPVMLILHMKNTISIVLFVVLIAVAAFQYFRICSLQKSVDLLNADNSRLQTQMQEAKRVKNAEHVQQPVVLPTFGPRKSAPDGSAVSQDDSIAVPGGGRMRFKSSVGDSATRRQSLQERNRAGIVKTYEDFFRKAGFSQQQQELFIEMQLSSREASRKLFEKMVASSSERDAATMQTIAQVVAQESKKELANQIREKFGEPTAALVAEYEVNIPIQAMTEKLQSALGKTNAQLTNAQVEQLKVAIMKNSRDAAGNFDIKSNYQLIVKDAAKFLTVEQLNALMKMPNFGKP